MEYLRKGFKVLNIEDDIYKHIEIKRALEFCGAGKIDTCEYQDVAFELIGAAEKEGMPYDLIVTDMHYPLSKGEIADFDAGMKFLEILKRKGIGVKVIVCSSMRLQVSEADACIWYRPSGDLMWDFREILERM